MIAFILVEPESPGNIGSSARALKNMGFSDLRLVRPPAAWRAGAKILAVSAADLLDKARVFDTLEEALADINWAVAATRRLGAKRGSALEYDKAIKKLARASKKNRAALVFGKESKGLDNASLALCDWTLTIPAHPVYPSLNLAQAVMVTAFSLYSAGLSKKPEPEEDKPWISKAEMAELTWQFEQALSALGYERMGVRMIQRIKTTFGGIFKRGRLLHSEAQMFRGLFRRIRERASQK